MIRWGGIVGGMLGMGCARGFRGMLPFNLKRCEGFGLEDFR